MDSTYSLADALAGLEKEKYARDPFRIVGSGLAGALTNAVNPQTYTGNPWAAIGAQFGASLLGSALEQQGLDRVRGQMAGYANELKAIGERPFSQQLESLNANPDYQSLVPYFTEEEMRRQEERRKLTDALVATRAKALLEAALSPPKRSVVMEGDLRKTQEFEPGVGWKTIAVAPRTAKASGEEGALPLEGLDPERAKIINSLPKQYRQQAIKEFGLADDLSKGQAVIGQAFEAVKKTGTFAAQMPFSNASAQVDAAKSAIMTALQANWKGPMSDTDLARIDGLMPRAYDTPERIEIRKQQMMEVLRNNAKSTPLLSAIRANKPSEPTVAPVTPMMANVPKRNAGETPSQYLKRIGAQ